MDIFEKLLYISNKNHFTRKKWKEAMKFQVSDKIKSVFTKEEGVIVGFVDEGRDDSENMFKIEFKRHDGLLYEDLYYADELMPNS